MHHGRLSMNLHGWSLSSLSRFQALNDECSQPCTLYAKMFLISSCVSSIDHHTLTYKDCPPYGDLYQEDNPHVLHLVLCHELLENGISPKVPA